MIAPTRTPMAFFYARVSDPKQVKQDDSIPFQIARMEAYYKFSLAPKGVDFGGIYSDPAVSARRRRFHLRKGGAAVMEVLKPGDYLIIDKVDRLARQPKDLYDMLDWFKNHEIHVHILGLLGMDIDIDSPIGKMVVGIFGICAEWESDVKSERTKAHNESARKAGRGFNHYPSIGTRNYQMRVRSGQTRLMCEWDPNQRGVMAEIVRLIDVEGMTNLREISRKLEIHLAHKNGRTFKDSAFYKVVWTQPRIRSAYYCEKYIRDHGIKDVTELPAAFTAAATKYCLSKGYQTWGDQVIKPTE